jgi:hypothetical protein
MVAAPPDVPDDSIQYARRGPLSEGTAATQSSLTAGETRRAVLRLGPLAQTGQITVTLVPSSGLRINGAGGGTSQVVWRGVPTPGARLELPLRMLASAPGQSFLVEVAGADGAVAQSTRVTIEVTGR